MQLPLNLQNAVQQLIENTGITSLIEGREELTHRYRHSSSSEYMTTQTQRLSYLVTRFPATYGALCKSFHNIPLLPIKTMLDLGSGPGTAMWAASTHFPDIEKFTLIEQDPSLISIGKKLAQSSENTSIQNGYWIEGNLEALPDLSPHDLVVLSYSIGEIDAQKMLSLIEKSWHLTQSILLVVEPGTPKGFERIRQIRSHLVQLGGYLVAPCPHSLACPMVGTDWCHFAARIERSSLHRKLKGGTLGYEDEKFSYVAVSKSPSLLPDARILAPPDHHSGHINFKLCTSEEIQSLTISKRRKELYKIARKAEWGDALETL